jgi:hypothetical protein
MPMRRIGQEEDVEGQSLRLRDADGNEWMIGGDRVKRIAWRGPDGTQHEVEGQALKGRFSRGDDVEGHGTGRFRRDDEEGEVTVTYFDDEGNAQDVEGHMPMRRLEAEEDVEGHMPMRRLDDDEDVEGHNMPMRR